MNDNQVTHKPDAEPQASVQATGLKTMHYQYASEPAEVEYWTHGFTCCSPWQDLSAHGHLYIRYVPSAYLLELDSLRAHLLQYSNVPMLYEHIVTRILDDLVSSCRPVPMAVEGDFAPQDGLGTLPAAQKVTPNA